MSVLRVRWNIGIILDALATLRHFTKVIRRCQRSEPKGRDVRSKIPFNVIDEKWRRWRKWEVAKIVVGVITIPTT